MIYVHVEYIDPSVDREIERWIHSNCKHFVRKQFLDMSDISTWQGPDGIMEYSFGNEKEALMFKLRWDQ